MKTENEKYLPLAIASQGCSHNVLFICQDVPSDELFEAVISRMEAAQRVLDFASFQTGNQSGCEAKMVSEAAGMLVSDALSIINILHRKCR
ncbi:hypothetical protein [Dickeya sp. ws52]|uniref:hypothetical protein n=1 Tax=Dickeya sp. ws52 TaxID=2576377 RepID=UPI00117FDDCE|nr:hypothetical protein [Dickeya sp. ws52]TYL43763.1 hypothetical protein FDP13_05275 [Dickeya sp. ws52]